MFKNSFLIIPLLAASAIAQNVSAGSSNRAETWEFTIGPRYLESATVEFEGGASADISGDLGFGFGFGYNLNSNLALRTDFSWNTTNYRATRVLDNGDSMDFGATLESSTVAFGADLYLTDGNVAPYVNATFGWTYVDTNIATERPDTACWWDPWWGYICNSYQSTLHETEFSYGASVGLRIDISRNFFLRAGVGEYFIDYKKAASGSDYIVSRLDIGFSY